MPLKHFLQARLSPEGVLGLNLTIGALVLVAATLLFSAIAEDVVNKERLTVIDVKVSDVVHHHTRAPLTAAMLVFTNIHSSLGISIITLLVVAYLVRHKLRAWALALALSVFGGMLLNVVLKNLFHRARPHFDDPILTLSSYGFPSGHTMMATTLYGALCALMVSHVRGWLWRMVTILAAAFLIGLVGFSRIYLGAHYLSDVLAAMVEGLAWLALCLTAVGTMQRWRRKKANANSNSEKQIARDSG